MKTLFLILNTALWLAFTAQGQTSLAGAQYDLGTRRLYPLDLQPPGRIELDEFYTPLVGQGRVAVGNKLYAVPYNVRDAGYGTLVYDGAKWSLGSTGLVGYADWMWHAGTNFWHTAAATTVATCGVYNVTGTFAQGERVNQDGSGAFGYYLYTDASGTNLILAVRTGTFRAESVAGDSNLSGAASGATARTAAHTSGGLQLILNRSVDPSNPATNWFPVMNFRGQNFKCQLIDCGVVSNKHLLLWPESRQAGGDAALWYTFAEDGNTWAKLFDVDTNAITHFHGGAYLTNTLYLFTGDTESNSAAGLLYCTNIHDLLNNPLTWRANWGLDLGGETRSNYMNYGAGTNWAVGTGQKYRILDLIPDSANRYAYFISDRQDVANTVNRLDLATREVTFGAATVLGPGAFGARLGDGTILFSTMSEWHTDDDWWNGDAWAHLYALHGLTPVEIFRAKRYNDHASLAYFNALFEWTPPNSTPRLVISSCRQNAVVEGGTLVFKRVASNAQEMLSLNARPAPPAPINLLSDSCLDDTNKYPLLFATNFVTLTRDTAVYDSNFNKRASLKLTPAGGGVPSITLRLPTRIATALAGRWATVRLRYLNPVYQDGSLTFNAHSNATVFAQEGLGFYESSPNWLTMELACFVPSYAQYLTLTITAGNASATSPLYLSDLALVPGNYLGRVPSHPLAADSLAPHVPLGNQESLIDFTAGNVQAYEGDYNASVLVATGTPSAARTLTFNPPLQYRRFLFLNHCGQAVTVKTSASTGATVAAGAVGKLYFNGTDFAAE